MCFSFAGLQADLQQLEYYLKAAFKMPGNFCFIDLLV